MRVFVFRRLTGIRGATAAAIAEGQAAMLPLLEIRDRSRRPRYRLQHRRLMLPRDTSCDGARAATRARRMPDLRIIAQVPNNPQPLGMGFAKNDVVLRSTANRALAAMNADGTLGARGVGALIKTPGVG